VSTSLKELRAGARERRPRARETGATIRSVKDVWELFKVISRRRKRREVDPTVAVLRECLEEMEKSGAPVSHSKQRLEDMRVFFEMVTKAYGRRATCQKKRRPAPDLQARQTLKKLWTMTEVAAR